MNHLKPCQYREEFPGGGNQFRCRHSKVVSADSVVSRGVCKLCTYSEVPDPDSHAQIPSNPQREPCMFLGQSLDSESNSFSCQHSCHQITTPAGCRKCSEYEPLLQSGHAVDSWAVGMTTAPRGKSTIARTLQSLSEAGWDEVSIFAEPDSDRDGLRSSHQWYQREEKLGAFPNWYLSLSELVMRFPHANAYFMCQDDVAFSKNLRSYIEPHLWLTTAAHVVSLYCATMNEQPGKSGFVELDAGWNVCGALALIFPNSVARTLLCDPLFFHHRMNGPRKGLVSIDSVLGLWCQKSGISFYTHQPSFTQHTGDDSSIWGRLHPSPRRSASDDPVKITNHPFPSNIMASVSKGTGASERSPP